MGPDPTSAASGAPGVSRARGAPPGGTGGSSERGLGTPSHTKRETMNSLSHPSRRALLGLSAAGLAMLVAGCVGEPDTPAFYRDLALPDAEVDAPTALSMVNGHRANNDRPPLSLDPKLVAIAKEEAERLAARNETSLSRAGAAALAARLEAAGYGSGAAVENVSAGYRTLAEAFSGWRDSGSHNENMLNPRVNRFGIATAYAPRSKYKVFWTAIFAEAAA